MATERQLQLEQAFRLALREVGSGVSTEFLIAATSERTQADPGEIIEAIEVVNRRVERQGPDVGTGGPDEDATALLLALGKAVTAIWSNLPQDVQHELFEHAVSAQDDATREQLAVFLHTIHFRTTDGIKARAIAEPDSLGG
jgi:class 3 adenylate cyclase